MEILKMQWNIENDNNSSNNNNNNNNNNNANNIIFTIKDTKLYVSVVTYQQQTIKIYQNFLANDFKDQFIGMNKTKNENKNAT